MRVFIILMIAVVAFFTSAWVARNLRDDSSGPRDAIRDPGRTLPAVLPALAHSESDLEILLCPREPDPGLRRALDVALLKRIGVPKPESWTLLHVLVSHSRAAPLDFDLGDLRLIGPGGQAVAPTRLRDLTEARSGTAALHLAARDPADPGPLPPHRLRRLFVALPSSMAFEKLQGGEYAGQALVQGRVDTLRLIEWLEAEAPASPWLASRFHAGRANEEGKR